MWWSIQTLTSLHIKNGMRHESKVTLSYTQYKYYNIQYSNI